MARIEVPLRAVVEGPPPGVAWALQLSKGDLSELVGPTRSSLERLVWDFSIEADRYDCITNTGQSSVIEVDRSGKPISKDKVAWKGSDEAVSLVGKPACDTSLINPESVIGDRDPLALLRQFAASTSDEYP